MGLERGSFRFGVAEFPLVESTDNALLQDADPALFWVLALLKSTFETYLSKRLMAQGLLHGYQIQCAVVNTAAVDPAPFLLADQFKFPLLCLYRKKDVWDDTVISYDKSVSTWEFAYILPPLTPNQVRELQPILRAVSITIRRVLHMGWDPGFLDGEFIWQKAGINKARLVDATYGGYARIDKLEEFYRALTGTIQVTEIERSIPEQFDTIAGADVGLDYRAPDGTEIADFIDIEIHPAPTVTAILPVSGSAAGGEPVTITGTGFIPGTRPRVLFDGASADVVTVVSSTSITCLTPPHAAYPAFLADLIVVAHDGQIAVLSDAFTFNA